MRIFLDSPHGGDHDTSWPVRDPLLWLARALFLVCLVGGLAALACIFWVLLG